MHEHVDDVGDHEAAVLDLAVAVKARARARLQLGGELEEGAAGRRVVQHVAPGRVSGLRRELG